MYILSEQVKSITSERSKPMYSKARINTVSNTKLMTKYASVRSLYFIRAIKINYIYILNVI